MSRPTKSLGTITAVDALESRLSEEILGGRITPGSRIKESVVAAEHQVARHTVRAACTRLAGRGLLSYRENHGWSVPAFDRDEYEDVLLLRGALEDKAMQVLLERNEQPSAESEAALRAMLAVDEGVPWSIRLELDCALHQALVDQVGGRRLSRAYSDILQQFRLCRMQSVEWLEGIPLDEWKAMHVRMVAALRDRDAQQVHASLHEMASTPWETHLPVGQESH